MADDRFDIGAFRPNYDDEDENFKQGPIIDITPRKEDDDRLFSGETDDHILDNLLDNQRLDRSDKTEDDRASDSVIGFVFLILLLIGAVILLFSLF